MYFYAAFAILFGTLSQIHNTHTNNTKIIEISTDIILEKKLDIELQNNTNQQKIIQAKENNNIDSHQQYLNLTDLIYENNNLNYEFFNIVKQREFIKNHMNKYLDKFDLLNNCYYKYLIFICCYIYLNVFNRNKLNYVPNVTLFFKLNKRLTSDADNNLL
jgi:hypothetical protein